MDEDGGIEINDIVRDLGRSRPTPGTSAPVVPDDGVMQLPVADDDDVSADDEGAASGSGSTKKKKLIAGLVAITAIVAVTIGLGAGLGPKKNKATTLTSANKAMSLEECLAIMDDYERYDGDRARRRERSFVEKRKLVRLGSGAGAAQDENHASKKVGVLRERVSSIIC